MYQERGKRIFFPGFKIEWRSDCLPGPGMAHRTQIQFFLAGKTSDGSNIPGFFFKRILFMKINMGGSWPMTSLAINAVNNLSFIKMINQVVANRQWGSSLYIWTMAFKTADGNIPGKLHIMRWKARTVYPTSSRDKIRNRQLEYIIIMPVKISLTFSSRAGNNIKTYRLLAGIVEIGDLVKTTIILLHDDFQFGAVIKWIGVWYKTSFNWFPGSSPAGKIMSSIYIRVVYFFVTSNTFLRAGISFTPEIILYLWIIQARIKNQNDQAY